MRVLLINSNTRADLMASAPIGLSYVADATSAAGHEVKVLDLCFCKSINRHLEDAVRSFSPDLVGVSIRNIDNLNLMRPISYVPDAVAVVQGIRGLTRVPVVLGGSGASLAPMRMLQVTGADYVVVSDGEEAFVKLIDRIGNGGSPRDIPGVGMFRDGEFHLTPPQLRDLSTGKVNIPRWIDLTPYRRIRSSYPILTKRGCVRKCIYCTYKIQNYEGNRVRLRNPEEVVEELEDVFLRFRPDSFEFVDPLLNAPSDHLVRVLELIVNRPWKARFSATAVSPKGLDKQLLDLMWRAGFRSFWLTPESASDTMLNNYRKGITTQDIANASEALRKTRFTVAWTFMIGGPGETNATVKETLDFHMKYLRNNNRPPWSIISYFIGVRIYPGTRLFEIAEAEGIVDQHSDPLEQHWYLSRKLDLKQAVRHILDVSLRSPELVSGFDEKYLDLSRVCAFLERITDIPKLHWRLIYRGNQMLRRLFLYFGYRPDRIAQTLDSRVRSTARLMTRATQ